MVSSFIARGADAYDRYMGRWSRRLAPSFLAFAGGEAGERVVDVGCGTGSLTFALAERADIVSIDAIDFEPAFVAALQARTTDPRITARQGDACALPYADDQFDRALSMLVLHFVSDPDRAAAELFRVVRPGGVAAATVWDTYGGMPSQRIFWDTVAALEPLAAARRSASVIRPMTQAGELAAAFARAGFQGVTEVLLPIRMDFANFDDYWTPLITGQGVLEAFLASLPDPVSRRLKDAVRDAYLCGRPDGPRGFASVAWAVRGVVQKS
jgi:ubiquinone/menaquinone biosynthesis C-methylase UbiE